MNYKLINNIDELNTFLHWLPNEEENEKYYIQLFARKKYWPQISYDKACLKRIVTRRTDIVNKIEQLEIAYGSYKIKDLVIPNEALALYISINPSNIERACYNTSVELIRNAQQDKFIRPDKIALNEIQKSLNNNFTILDVDNKDILSLVLNRGLDILQSMEYNVIETCGGFHVIIKHQKDMQRNWYPEICKILKPDQKGTLLSPIPGCVQGNFVPRFYNVKN